MDTFNNEILADSVTDTRGSNIPYHDCLAVLKQLAGKKEEQKPEVVFHTDQGAVYASKAFCQAHSQYNILRSMSRGGTPTDNPIIEALNGWMKDELYLDFNLAQAQDVPALLEQYVLYFITIGVMPPWATKAQFSTEPNWASLNAGFVVFTFP